MTNIYYRRYRHKLPYWVVRSWLVRAREQYLAYRYTPEGRFCWHCGKRNFFVDDCGYFYTNSGHKSTPTCETCFRGWAGKWHTHWHGMGDR